MSDANEERLLTALLREIADADAAAAAPEDLEQRTLSLWERSRLGDVTRTGMPSGGRVKPALALAAAVLLLVGGSIHVRSGRTGSPPRTADVISTAPEQVIAASTAPEVPSIAPQPVALSAKRSTRPPASPKSVTVDFVPLVPMAAEELSGSFQIVRVQMSRAALRALASAVDPGRVDDPVQADLLLGEDGMARAIRVSANGRVPWRSQ
jgi:hypothetical protein